MPKVGDLVAFGWMTIDYYNTVDGNGWYLNTSISSMVVVEVETTWVVCLISKIDGDTHLARLHESTLFYVV